MYAHADPDNGSNLRPHGHAHLCTHGAAKLPAV
jgi:hypothetical protein